MSLIGRRDALKLISGGSLALTLPGSLLNLADAATGPPDIVSISGGDPMSNTRAAIEALGGMKRFVSKGDKVVIKPNMGYANQEYKATTTEPLVVRALAEMALEAEAKHVLVMDLPIHRYDLAIEATGIKDKLVGLDDTFVYHIANEKFFREIVVPKGKALHKVKVAIDILEADVIINVPISD